MKDLIEAADSMAKVIQGQLGYLAVHGQAEAFVDALCAYERAKEALSTEYVERSQSIGNKTAIEIPPNGGWWCTGCKKFIKGSLSFGYQCEICGSRTEYITPESLASDLARENAELREEIEDLGVAFREMGEED